MRALALAALLAAPAAARRPVTPPAPEFPADAVWINSQPLPLSRMRGRKAVLVAFLNPSGLHSLRLVPVLKALFDRYALSQLMVVGVVTPELEVQKNPAWIRAAAKRLGLEFPVVVDSDRRLWNAYANDGWPSVYLIDRKGLLVFDHLGEGDYEELERVVREELDELTSGLPEPVEPPEPRTQDCGRATADVAMGARAKRPPLRLDAEIESNHLLVASRDGEVATRGRWTPEADGLRLAQGNKDQLAFVRVIYQGAQAMAVLAPAADKPQRFFVKVDDQWLYEGVAGKDVRYDDDGRSYVLADEPRLYDLARDSGKPREHELQVLPEGKGGGVFGFSFADRCLATSLP